MLNRRTLTAVIVSVVLTMPSMPVLAAVWTDQDDYSPGSVVTISGDNSNFEEGEGYLPGETVVVNVYGPNDWTASCSGEADGDGAWSCQVTLDSDPDIAVGDYSYIATGQSSGTVESGTFTDAVNTQTTVTSSVNPSNLGASVTFTATVKSAQGAPPAFTGTVTAGNVVFGTGAACATLVVLQAATAVDLNGQVTFVTNALPLGNTTIRACYLGSGSGATALNSSTGTVTQTVVQPSGPDLTADKDNDVSGVVNLGDSFTWTIRVENEGDEDADFEDEDVLLLDELTPGPSYSNLDWDDDNVDGDVVCDITDDTLTCLADGAVTFEDGDYLDVWFDVEPTADDYPQLDNPVEEGICMADPVGVLDLLEADTENNHCSDSVTVTAPDLTAEKTNDAGGFVNVGDSFNWTIAVSNDGDGEAAFAEDDVILRDDLPVGPTYGTPTVANASGVGGTGTIVCDIVADTLECTADGGDVTIADGGSFDVEFEVEPTLAQAGTTLNNPRDEGTCAVDPDGNVPEANGDPSGEGDAEENNDCLDETGVGVTAIALLRGGCTFDLYENSIPSFRNIFTPDMNTGDFKLFATNPGQFFLNVATYIEEGDTVTVTLPFPFVTQGAEPIKVYGDRETTTDNGKVCVDPFDLLWSQTDQVALGESYDGFGQTADIEIVPPDEEFEGWVWIRIHLDYGLKGLVTGCANFNGDASPCTYDGNPLHIGDEKLYEFSFTDGLSGDTTVESRNEFKKANGVAGAVIGLGAEPLGGTTIQIWQGSKLWKTVVADDDGWYMALFKYTGKPTTFTVKVVQLGWQQSFTLKSNGFAVANFIEGQSVFELISDTGVTNDSGGDSDGGGGGKGKGKLK